MPVICLYAIPAPTAWDDLQIEICSLEQPLRTVAGTDLARLERVKLKAPLICQIFNWAETVEWEGYRFADFLNLFKVETHPEGYYAIYSRDGVYFETLSADEARDPRVLLAYALNGSPLPVAHGGPLRLVVPFLQGYKSVKWVSSIRAFRNDPVGIKRLLGQSLTGQINQAWRDRYQIVLPPGKSGDPSLLPLEPPLLPTKDSSLVPADPIMGTYSSQESFPATSRDFGGAAKAGLREILAFLRPGKHHLTRQALEAAGVVAYTTFRVLGRGRQRGLRFPTAEQGEAAVQFLPKQCLSILVQESQVHQAVEAIHKVNRTGKGEHGDGKVFVLDVTEVVRISTDERGREAL